jgi:hypothetical protein
LKDYFIDGCYIPGTAGAARGYYSANQFHELGAPNVASGTPWSQIGRFLDFSNKLNPLSRSDNKDLLDILLKKLYENSHTFNKNK